VSWCSRAPARARAGWLCARIRRASSRRARQFSNCSTARLTSAKRRRYRRTPARTTRTRSVSARERNATCRSTTTTRSICRDYSKCILCWRCVQACGEDVQWTFAIHKAGRGFETRIATFFDKPIPESTCVYCGNCVQACPTGALKAKREFWIETGRDVNELVRHSRLERRKKR